MSLLFIFDSCKEILCSNCSKDLGSVVQSIATLMSLLVVKILTVLVSAISNSQVFLL